MEILYTLMVPQCFNDGRPIPDETLSALKREILSLAGGLTVYESAMGCWIGGHRTYREPVVPIMFVAGAHALSFDQLTQIVRKWVVEFEQEELFVIQQLVTRFSMSGMRISKGDG